jgi:hypothetical protein
VAGCGEAAGMREGYLGGALSPSATPRQMDVLAAFVTGGGSVVVAANLASIHAIDSRRLEARG